MRKERKGKGGRKWTGRGRKMHAPPPLPPISNSEIRFSFSDGASPHFFQYPYQCVYALYANGEDCTPNPPTVRDRVFFFLISAIWHLDSLWRRLLWALNPYKTYHFLTIRNWKDRNQWTLPCPINLAVFSIINPSAFLIPPCNMAKRIR